MVTFTLELVDERPLVAVKGTVPLEEVRKGHQVLAYAPAGLRPVDRQFLAATVESLRLRESILVAVLSIDPYGAFCLEKVARPQEIVLDGLSYWLSPIW